MRKALLGLFVLPVIIASGMTFEQKGITEFFDITMNDILEKFDIPGAVLSFVSDGEVLYVRGYGYSNLESKTPMKADSLVRIGSVSKLFTWISLMQLYELGEIDLEANVNDYISGFKIPDTFPKPITIENLLTHTPGFEETSYNPIQFEEYTMQPLGEALKQMPERAFEPGKFAAYSNYGMALAGYIVQEVSGVEFSDYVDGRNESPTSFEKITIPPAGSITSSAGDMAKFIIANIQKGEFEGERILNEETAELMQSVHFRHDPRLNGMCYGFYEMSMNGLRLIGHGGDTGFFHSLLVFSTEDNWGLFVSFNSNGKGSARDALLNAFMDRFYPADRSIERKEVSYFDKIKLTGDYISNRRIFSDPFERLRSWMNPDITAEMSPNGDLIIRGIEYCFIDDDLATAKNEKSLVAFKTEGAKSYLFPNSAPMIAFEKIPWYMSQELVGSMIFVLLAGLFILLP